MKIVATPDLVWRGKVVPPAVRMFGGALTGAADLKVMPPWVPVDQFREFLVGFLTPQQQVELVQFLRSAVDGRHSSAELKGLLNRIAPGANFGGNAGAGPFLQLVVDMITKETAK